MASRRAAGQRQHAIHVGRVEVEGEVGARLGRPVAGDRAAHGDARARQVGHPDLVQPQGAGVARDVELDAGDRLAAVLDAGDLELEADRRTEQGEDRRDRGDGRGRGCLRAGRQVGVEIERAQLDVRDDRQRHGEGHDDAAGTLEIVELDRGIGHLHVAAHRAHAAIHGEPGELAGRDRRDVDREPRQGLAQARPDQAEGARRGGARRIARQGGAGLHDEVARQGGGEFRHGDGAAARLELQRHAAHGPGVVDHLADLERQLRAEVRQPARSGGRRCGRRRCGGRTGGRGGRFRRRRGRHTVGHCQRRQPAVEIEPAGAEAGVDRECGHEAQHKRARAAVLAQGQLEVAGRRGGRRELDGTVEAELAGQQRRQARRRLAGHPDQALGEGHQVVRSGRRPARQPRRRAELAQGSLEGELAAARFEGDVDGVTGGSLCAHGQVDPERRIVDDRAAGQRIGPVDRADRGAEVGLAGRHRQAGPRIAEDQRAVLDGEPAERQRLGRGRFRGGGHGLGDRGRELPVRFALGVDLENDLGLDQRHLAGLDLAPQQGEQHGLHDDRLHLDHVGVLRARQVEEFHAVERDGGRRQQRQADRPLDDDVATGRALHLGDDLGLVGRDVDEQRCCQQRRDQQADEAGDTDQKPLALALCHGTPPSPDSRSLAQDRVVRHALLTTTSAAA